jgi:hypothetical protein
MNDFEFDAIKGAYNKFCEPGFGLTDDELDILIEHMTKLEDLLLPLGQKFFLSRRECSEVVRVCNGWKNERKISDQHNS